jgi:hypothetical protein
MGFKPNCVPNLTGPIFYSSKGVCDGHVNSADPYRVYRDVMEQENREKKKPPN